MDPARNRRVWHGGQRARPALRRGISPLLFTLGMYKLIRKGVNINWILLGTVAFGMAASALGLL
ncbi:PTS system mannose/fructose/sorbose family transporter subunit IID [Klebsiella pneumoniae]|uniref:PTS system mannose/fructose/sorbose family transporter subunit IID n=1 Tax=Klebsiella pneumoniae TaxID=573 RepID=UPI00396F2852